MRSLLVTCLTMWPLGAAWATPPAQPAPPPRAAGPATETPGAGAPNDELIEFLGTDDVGDAAWWEFLQQSGPRQDRPRRPAAPAPTDSKP